MHLFPQRFQESTHTTWPPSGCEAEGMQSVNTNEEKRYRELANLLFSANWALQVGATDTDGTFTQARRLSAADTHK